MKKYYSLVVSVLNENGNRVEAHEIIGGNNKKEIIKFRTQLKKAIQSGKYDRFNQKGCNLEADIEVHTDDTYELIEII